MNTAGMITLITQQLKDNENTMVRLVHIATEGLCERHKITDPAAISEIGQLLYQMYTAGVLDSLENFKKLLQAANEK